MHFNVIKRGGGFFLAFGLEVAAAAVQTTHGLHHGARKVLAEVLGWRSDERLAHHVRAAADHGTRSRRFPPLG